MKECAMQALGVNLRSACIQSDLATNRQKVLKIYYIVPDNSTTIKFLNFWTPENFAIIYLIFQTKRPNLRVIRQKDANANAIANSEDPDQTTPRGAV